MLSVKDIMSVELISVTPELTLRNLVDLMAREHVSGVPVRAGRRVAGVVTADDVLAFLASQPVVPAAREDEADEEEPPEAEEWEEGTEVPAAFFLDTWSDAGADVVERFRADNAPEWDLLGEHTVAEAMSRRVLSIGPDDAVADAARRMDQAGVHRLLVTQDGGLIGIVSASDIMLAVADGRLVASA